MKNSIAIKLDSISFSYEEGLEVLSNIAFEINDNEYVCIIGHNGSGKSTISKILMGLLKPTSGSIEVYGNKINHLNLTYLRKNIGIIFQNPDSQFIGLTPEDDIAFGLENLKINREEIGTIIRNVSNVIDIKDFLNVEANMLSGGQKQKVAIASILAMNPRIIIFDESTSMLDPKSKKELKDIFLDLKTKSKKTIISITHDMDEVLLCDKVIVLDKGKLVKIGPPSDVFKDLEFLKKISLDFPFILKLSWLLKEKNKKINLSLDNQSLIGQLCKKK
ncbi:MAG: energy-coupling factor transporter ATPase [Malacoplasma sp.]